MVTNKKRIKETDIIPAFLKIVPGFNDRWKVHIKFWGKEERGNFNDMAEFSHFVVESYKEGKTEKFPELFKQIEFFLKNGSPKIKEIIAIGILEDIQTIASNVLSGYDVFEKWLGPVSKKYWLQIEKMWEGKSSLADVIRAERKK